MGSLPRMALALFARLQKALLLCAMFLAGGLAIPASGEALDPGPPVRDDRHIGSRRVASWVALKQRNVVMQRRDYSCGAAALATLIRYHLGDNVNEDLFLRALDDILTLEEIEDRIENGLAMSDLRKAAVKTGYLSVVAKLTLDKLFAAKTPLIVGITDDGYKHFVVYRGTDYFWVYLADPIRGNLRLPICEFKQQWQKNLVLAVAKKGEKVKTSSPLSVKPEEMAVGRTNDQLISTLPSRGSIARPRKTR